MTKYKVLVIQTKFWHPRENYLEEIVKSIKGKAIDGDFIVISEKAISTALSNMVDESKITPSLSARFIAKYWMRFMWGYILGPLCHLRRELVRRLREYPADLGGRHKEVALWYAGLLQALMFGSEGGIDGSNLPYSYVSLPLKNAEEIAQEIREKIFSSLRKNVVVIIVDTDKTYSYRNFHFTPRPKPVKGIHSFGGFITYVIGRALKFRRRATPIAVAGCQIQPETALELSEIANRARGFGAGRTVWDMAERFKVDLAKVSWEMLEMVKHKPIIIIRSIGKGDT